MIDQLEFEYIDSGSWVGPRYFSGKCWENVHLKGTRLRASNAEVLLVRQCDTEGKCGLRGHEGPISNPSDAT